MPTPPPRTLDAQLHALVVEAVRELLPEIREIVREEVARLPAEPDRLLRVDEAAARLGMTPEALRKAAQRGTVPVERLGRQLRFRVRDLAGRERRPR